VEIFQNSEPYALLLQCIGEGQINAVKLKTSQFFAGRIITLDSTEFTELINQHGKDIYGFCCRLTGNQHEAEDLYQDAFLKAFELMKQLDASYNPKSFILSIVIRLWKNKKRKYAWRQRIVTTVELNDGIDTEVDSSNSVVNQILLDEESIMVRNAVKKMDEKYKLIIYLYYTAELSIEEISKTLSIPLGTVKSRLFKARKIIKKNLEVDGYED
jgi:RNA polymerase sigma-70 factor (ECF subfamily)